MGRRAVGTIGLLKFQSKFCCQNNISTDEEEREDVIAYLDYEVEVGERAFASGRRRVGVPTDVFIPVMVYRHVYRVIWLLVLTSGYVF